MEDEKCSSKIDLNTYFVGVFYSTFTLFQPTYDQTKKSNMDTPTSTLSPADNNHIIGKECIDVHSAEGKTINDRVNIEKISSWVIFDYVDYGILSEDFLLCDSFYMTLFLYFTLLVTMQGN